jgi:hypothetical protein
MQKIISMIVLGVFLFVLSVNAHDSPRAEVFGGYQYTLIGGLVNANGWNAAITGYVNRWFGVTADFSGMYKGVGTVNANAITYTFGPTFSLRGERVTPFVHTLLGGFHASAGLWNANVSTQGFAAMIGGGVDVKINSHLAVRAVQADWIIWRTLGVTETKNARISTGLVVRF